MRINNAKKMKKLIEDLEVLVKDEYNRSMENYPLFTSQHEGYAVLREELEEAFDELENVKEYSDWMWKDIKANNRLSYLQYADYVKTFCLKACAELVQSAAMCDKFLTSDKLMKDDKKVTK